MPDPVSVCNQALAQLGSTLITSFTDGTSVSTLCGQIYPEARDAVLTMHPWNFTHVLTTLARSAEAPAWKWVYQYPLPTTPYCLVVREVDPEGTPWEVALNAEGHRVLLSDETTISIGYTSRVEDLNLWQPLALQVLVHVLASRLAKPITGQNSTAEYHAKLAFSLLPQAQKTDGQEAYPRYARISTALVQARHHSTGGVWPYTTTRTP